jgi:hypothetical protein
VGLLLALAGTPPPSHAELFAGVARRDITDREAGPVNDPLYAKALVLKDHDTTAVLVTVDAVAIGEIGRIRNDFLPNLRARLQQDLGIPASNLVVNASHCHGTVRADTESLVFQAIREAAGNLTPVQAGAGSGHEDGISENRRLRMKDGSEVDMRRAYALPPDADIASVGPIDPQIGLLRLDRTNGQPFAVLYNFACHPIMNPPNKGNSADFPGFASLLVEEALGHGAMAFFVQGCGGDINPVRYKDVLHPPDAEPLGHRLGLKVLTAARQIITRPKSDLVMVRETLSLPRGADLEKRMTTLQAEQTRLLTSLEPTDINFKTFLPLLLQHRLGSEFPGYYAQGYLHDKSVGRESLKRLDDTNRQSLDAYLRNIQIMERLTRLNVNLALLRKHADEAKAAANQPVAAEMLALRVGDFRMVTFPGELTVEIGLNIKRRATAPHTFVAGYCNGYLYYLPTASQRGNTGYAQEDCDCLIAPEWQQQFESKALNLLGRLER